MTVTLELTPELETALKEEAERQLSYCTPIPLPFANVIEVHSEIDDYSRHRGATMGKNGLWGAAGPAF